MENTIMALCHTRKWDNETISEGYICARGFWSMHFDKQNDLFKYQKMRIYLFYKLCNKWQWKSMQCKKHTVLLLLSDL